MVDGSRRSRAWRTWRPILVVLLVLTAALPARADLANEHARARVETIERLDELGRWCGERRLYARRAEIARSIIALDPDHRRARGWLKQRKDADGSWSPQPGASPPRDLDTEALDAYATTRATVLEPALERLEGIVRRYGETLDPVRLRPVHRDLLDLVPDEPRYRAWVGEEFRDGRWVLEEAARSVGRRRALAARVRRLEAKTGKAVPTELTASEAESPVAWAAHVKCGDARVLGAVGTSEIRATARLLDLTARFISAVTDETVRLGDGTTAYLFADRETSHKHLMRHPFLTPLQRQDAIATPSYAVPLSYEIVVHHERRRVRADRAVGHAVAALLASHFKLSQSKGWLGLGLRLRLTQEILGSAPTWFPRGSWMGDEDRRQSLRMTSAAADWRRLARDVFADGQPIDLARLSTLEAANWRPRDALCAYGLATYLLEGRPDAFATLLGKATEGKRVDLELRDALDLHDLEIVDRTRRFLAETTPRTPGAEPDRIEIEAE